MVINILYLMPMIGLGWSIYYLWQQITYLEWSKKDYKKRLDDEREENIRLRNEIHTEVNLRVQEKLKEKRPDPLPNDSVVESFNILKKENDFLKEKVKSYEPEVNFNTVVVMPSHPYNSKFPHVILNNFPPTQEYTGPSYTPFMLWIEQDEEVMSELEKKAKKHGALLRDATDPWKLPPFIKAIYLLPDPIGKWIQIYSRYGATNERSNQ